MITNKIIDFYSDKKVIDFVKTVNDSLKIVYNANIDVNNSINNLIYSVFSIFSPEFYEQSQLEN